MEFIYFIFNYFLLILCVIGYGFFFSNKLTKYNDFTASNISLGLIGIFGVFFLIFLSFISNLLISHNNHFNLLILLIGLILLFAYSKTNWSKINIKFFLPTFLLSILFILHYKTHDDFSYYHLSFISNLTNNKIEFGLGHFDVAFNHVSSLFYFHSLFKTPFTNDFYYFLGQSCIVLFTNIIILENIFEKYKNDKLSTSFFLSIFCLIFINVFFYRIAEHGTDRSAQILFFLSFIFIVVILEGKSFSNKIFEALIIIFTLIVTIKSFYLLYSLMLFFIYIKYFKINQIFQVIKKFPIIYLCLLPLVLLIIHNISHSGCMLYPLSFTCLDQFFWGYSKAQVSAYMEWYELWSKAGANPNMIVDDVKLYLNNFNWVSNWIQNYFFNKFSDYFLGIILAVLICAILFKIKKFSFNGFKKFNFIYLLLIILFLEWFLNHPALRYGGYVLVFLIICFPFCIILKNQNYDFKSKKNSIKYIFLITITIFCLRNIDRIIHETKIYKTNFINAPYYKIDNKFYTIQNHKDNFFIKKNECSYKNSIRFIKCKKIYTYNFYYLENN